MKSINNAPVGAKLLQVPSNARQQTERWTRIMSQKMIIVLGVIALLVAAIAIQYIYNPHPELNFGASMLLPSKLPPL
jgi:hypothetical protein